jgi:hypothetical protein
MQKSGFFTKIIFAVLFFKVSAWLSNHAVYKIGLIERLKKFSNGPKCVLSEGRRVLHSWSVYGMYRSGANVLCV